jgi:tRNA (cmo5U34)-methyltransferase
MNCEAANKAFAAKLQKAHAHIQAKQRFEGNLRVTYSLQEHSRLSASLEYDLVISALSIHHLEDSDKRTLSRKIYEALRPGGMFINVDQALTPTYSGEEQYDRKWLEDVKANGASEITVPQAREQMREDKNALLADQLTWLDEAGFEGIDCWYKRFRFVVYGASKKLNMVLHWTAIRLRSIAASELCAR